MFARSFLRLIIETTCASRSLSSVRRDASSRTLYKSTRTKPRVKSKQQQQQHTSISHTHVVNPLTILHRDPSLLVSYQIRTAEHIEQLFIVDWTTTCKGFNRIIQRYEIVNAFLELT